MNKHLGYYQLCPKCNGQGTVSKPPHVAGDVTEWVDSSCVHVCDVCNGAKIIPRPIVEDKIIEMDEEWLENYIPTIFTDSEGAFTGFNEVIDNTMINK